MNLETLKRILDKKKTTLSSLRNIDWRTVKAETEKINDIRKTFNKFPDIFEQAFKIVGDS